MSHGSGGDTIETSYGEVMLLSADSPLGTTITGHIEGESFNFSAPNGSKIVMTIERIF
jgi:transcription elongation GreA/GreB family factor